MDEAREAVFEETREDTSAKLGMWLFILSELLLFGGMFILYSAYRYKDPVNFHHASRQLEILLGTLNTIILLTSSLCVAASITALRKGERRLSMVLLMATIALGLLFLGNKGFEWGGKIEHGIYPNSPTLLARAKGEILFFGLYYVMTGLHGLHVLVGVCILSVMLILIDKNRLNQMRFIPLENAGLYWHLVDIIWIFLYPLFYLIT
ncbi:MAG TPA: cytochrome c oxidase subunit 3 family protein [Thermodesulfobacteriota bacterium]|nr:cytochrome c oxidase subunit 3 family protein [Thermodesulfobacteriota bacterium]